MKANGAVQGYVKGVWEKNGKLNDASQSYVKLRIKGDLGENVKLYGAFNNYTKEIQEEKTKN